MRRIMTVGLAAGTGALAALGGVAQAATPRVIGGQPTTAVEAPFVAALRVSTYGLPAISPEVARWIDRQRDGVATQCGAALIAPRWALTAAHCVVLDDALRAADVPRIRPVLVFGKDRIDRPDTPSTRRIQVDHVILHPRVPDVAGSDLALLHLREPVSATPLALPAHGARPSDGTAVTAYGWGVHRIDSLALSARLRRGELRIVSDDAAADFLGAAFDGSQMLGADAAIPGTGGYACFGDSGGPLVEQRGGVATLVGLTSWGAQAAAARAAADCARGPGAFVRVDAFRAWLDAAIRVTPRFVRRPDLELRVEGVWARLTKGGAEVEYDGPDFGFAGTVELRAGSRLRCTANARPDEYATSLARITYRWLRAGRPIRGANARTYRLRRPDLSAGVACAVTVRTDFGVARGRTISVAAR